MRLAGSPYFFEIASCNQNDYKPGCSDQTDEREITKKRYSPTAEPHSDARRKEPIAAIRVVKSVSMSTSRDTARSCSDLVQEVVPDF